MLFNYKINKPISPIKLIQVYNSLKYWNNINPKNLNNNELIINSTIDNLQLKLTLTNLYINVNNKDYYEDEDYFMELIGQYNVIIMEIIEEYIRLVQDNENNNWEDVKDKKIIFVKDEYDIIQNITIEDEVEFGCNYNQNIFIDFDKDLKFDIDKFYYKYLKQNIDESLENKDKENFIKLCKQYKKYKLKIK